MQIVFGFLVNLEIGALLSFLLVPFITVPLLIVHYRRYGRVGRRRAIAFYLLVITVTFTIALTLFPLPDPDTLVCVGGNPMPFRAFGEMARYADRHGSGLGDLLTNRPVFQYLFNIAMFVPLGVLLRRCYRWSWLRILAASAGFSTLLELTQATGDWGLYDCAYRVGDVDDVIANTLGGLVGAAIAPLVVFLPSDVREVRPATSDGRPSLVARGIATAIDLVIAGGASVSAWSIVGIPLVFVVAPLVLGGATPGKWLLRLRITTTDGSPATLRALVTRAIVLLCPWIVIGEVGDRLPHPAGTVAVLVSVVVGLAGVAYPFVVLWLCSRRADGAGPHDRLAGTLVAATRVVDPEADASAAGTAGTAGS